MLAELVEAIRIYVRYETPNDKGETRRERNDRLEENTPEFKIPEDGRYIWDWYFQVTNSLTRVHDGICHPIPPSEFHSFFVMTETIVYSHEYAILREMDSEFCTEMNKELKDHQAQQKEEHERNLKAAAAKNKR